ncbi:hypothetical protein GCM10027053_01230 [Intrasporangium mesophilum]
MIVVVADERLNQLLSTGALITATWPRAAEDVRMLIAVLRFTIPTLADVLGTGLVTLPAASARTDEVTLAAGQATLHALALAQNGERVADPQRNAHQVFRLDVRDVAAEGRSASKVAR